jgi:tetratricopeptide (TPR) repeat protein
LPDVCSVAAASDAGAAKTLRLKQIPRWISKGPEFAVSSDTAPLACAQKGFMNFLLHMIGIPYRTSGGLRPSGNERLRATAASSAARGNLHEALHAYRLLATESKGSISDTLIRAHLHLAVCEYAAAAEFFSTAVNRLEDPPRLGLEKLIDAADGHLRQSRYVLAAAFLQRARTSVDTLLAGHAGLAVANARLAGSTAVAPGSLVPLAKLGDLILRMLARTHLACNLADSLRRRQLRHDLAPWATTGGSIENLLQEEFEQLQIAAKQHRSHAELHYRLGLVARTLGRNDAAVAAFSRVLSLHPHHVASAVRLAATHLQLRQKGPVFPLLAVAFAAPPNVLQQYANLADAAQSRAFDRTADFLSQKLDEPAARSQADVTVKANLAFALGELGLLDSARAEWREAIPA